MHDRVAVVTGGSRGIGAAIAYKLATLGYYVAAVSQSGRKPSLYEDRIKAYRADVTSLANVTDLYGWVIRDFSRVDVLINNAGILGQSSPITETDPATWSQVIATKLTGSFHMIKIFGPELVRQKGRIINISSLAGIRGLVGHVAYATANAGVIGLTMSVAKELGPLGVTCNALCPAAIETEMFRSGTNGHPERDLGRLTVGRIGQPREVAHLVANLCAPESGYVNGAVINIDGGLSL